MVRITSYLGGYEDRIRETLDVDDEEYARNPSYWQGKAREKLIEDYGGAWSDSLKRKVHADNPPVTVVEKAVEKLAPRAQVREAMMKDIRDAVKELNSAEIKELRVLLRGREKEARGMERQQREVARLEMQIAAMSAKLEKLKAKK